MEDERDLVVFEDDDGNELTMEVLEYFFYEGKEYAILVNIEDEGCSGCEENSCDSCGNQRDAFVMEVVPVGEDEEEFIPVEEALADRLIEAVENGLYDIEDELEEDDEDFD